MKVLITGGTGSLGSRLAAYCVAQGHELTILSRNAHRQAELMRSLAPHKVHWVLADICDEQAVARACRGQEVVVHAAAQKRIERGQSDPWETVRVNVLGTQNVLLAAQAAPSVRQCLLISTDKSAAPLNLYGVSKAAAERLWLQANTEDCRFSALRYGNVIESNGSVWHLWHEQLARWGYIKVRRPEPTRFVLSLEAAVALVQDALDVMVGGEVLVPGTLPAFSLWDLAREIEPDEERWRIEDLLPGEKRHEILVAEGERAEQVSKLLWSVHGGFDNQSHQRFCSQYARQLSGAEVVEALRGDRSRDRVELVAACS